jgi:hypothetical protein
VRVTAKQAAELERRARGEVEQARPEKARKAKGSVLRNAESDRGEWRTDANPAYEVRDLGIGSSREYRDAPGYENGIPIDRTEWLAENKRKREERETRDGAIGSGEVDGVGTVAGSEP